MELRKFIRDYLLLSFILPGLFLYACSKNQNIEIEVVNNSEFIYDNALIELDDAKLLSDLQEMNVGKILVKSGNTILPSQPVDSDSDGNIDQLLVLSSFKAGENQVLTIGESQEEIPAFEKRTQAELSIKEGGYWEFVTKNNGNEQYEYKEGTFKNIKYLRVPDEHTDHSFYIRYEGPGWESDKVGYRFYLDWRNATDIFGKKTSEMVLQNVGLDGFDSYHESADWGMDILKVGSSLGIGSFGYWKGDAAVRVENTDSISCRIAQNGIIRSSIETSYYGWADANTHTDLTSLISIDAGSRLSHVQLHSSQVLDNLCTGIVKHDQTEFIHNAPEGKTWAYIATFGKQSLNNDMLGMAVFYKQDNLIQKTEDEYNYVVVLNPNENLLDYYFSAVWEADMDSIATLDEFIGYLGMTLDKLNNPLEIKH